MTNIDLVTPSLSINRKSLNWKEDGSPELFLFFFFLAGFIESLAKDNYLKVDMGVQQRSLKQEMLVQGFKKDEVHKCDL